MKKLKKPPVLTLCLVFLIGGIIGLSVAFLVRDNHPTVLVWAADKDVKVPDGLVSYLEKNHNKDCRDYKGTGSVVGVALFSIYETYGNHLAKMTYGCGNNLTSSYDGYMVAYKTNDKWRVIEPSKYFMPQGGPSCQFLEANDIPASFEPQCVNSDNDVVSRK